MNDLNLKKLNEIATGTAIESYLSLMLEVSDLTTTEPFLFSNFVDGGVNAEWEINGGRVTACIGGRGGIKFMEILKDVDKGRLYRKYITEDEFYALIRTVDSVSAMAV